MFTAALFTIAESWKQPQGPSTEEWIKKVWRMFIHLGSPHADTQNIRLQNTRLQYIKASGILREVRFNLLHYTCKDIFQIFTI